MLTLCALYFYSLVYLTFASLIIPSSPSINLFGIDSLQHDILVNYEKLQSHLSNNNEDCFKGSFAYNGSCIYFSSKHQRLSWDQADQFCRKLPLNTSFLIIENDNEVEFLRRSLIQIKLKENPVDQLVFLIGYSQIKNEWKWANNISLNSTSLKIVGEQTNLLESSLGRCGSIALDKNYKLILKSAPCESLHTRFICKYNLNPCFNNNMCGAHGKCINFYQSFYCDCESVSIFYTGKYCNKLNSKAIQTLAAIAFIVLLSLYILLLTKPARKSLRYLITKLRLIFGLENGNNSKQSLFLDIEKSKDSEKVNHDPLQESLPKQSSSFFTNGKSISILSSRQFPRLPMRSISKTLRAKRTKILNFFVHSSLYGYILLVLMVILLTIIQVVLIDLNSLALFNLKARIKNNSPLITILCINLEKNYYTEEIIYLGFSSVFFLLLIFKQKKRRFTNYIIEKFRNYPEVLEAPKASSITAKCSVDSLFSFIPSFSFSTCNRAQAAAVYVIYTYDVLNIFMFIYASDTSLSLFPLTNDFAGVLFDFFKQILQVLLIGVKFYPILIVADLDPSIVIYLATAVYVALIWWIRFINKAFCSHTSVIVEVTIRQLVSGINKRLKTNIYNFQSLNLTLGIFRSERQSNQQYDSKYRAMIKEVFPQIFESTFKYEDYDMEYNPYLKQQEEVSRFQTKYPNSNNYAEPLRPLSLNEANIIKNLNSIHRYGENEFIHRWVGLLQNLPFYVTISYLLTRYGLLFTASLVDRLKETCIVRRYHKDLLSIESKSAKNLNDIIDRPEAEEESEPLSFQKELSDSQSSSANDPGAQVKEKNILGNSFYRIQNNNYKYIYNLLNSNKQKRVVDKSFLYSLFERILLRLYRNVPYMKFSKQFINTYIVAFMIVYFFTLFGIRLNSLLNDLLVKLVELASQYIYGVSKLGVNSHDFKLEIRLTCFTTSVAILVQLFLSIKSFQEDLLKLHKAENVFGSLINNYDFKKYAKIIKRRNRMSSEITSDSIHFPGYLIAHLVYGYLVLFAGLFGILMLIKFCYLFPNIVYSVSQLVLPLVIMVILKLIIVQFMTKFIFLKRNSYRISRSVPYHTIAYFNFFFDCFLGLVACMSRVWLTNFISLVTLARLDVSVFNKDGIFIVRRLDKGYTSYINYVRMEHWYNNPVVNGFCEMLIESMLDSKLAKRKVLTNGMKNRNPDFKFKSSLKLRNFIYLLVLLKNVPFLRQHRYHLIKLVERKTDKNESFFDSFDRQRRRFNKSKRRHVEKATTKETQLFDILKKKNEMIIQQNLDRIMVSLESHETVEGSDRDDTMAQTETKLKFTKRVVFIDAIEEDGRTNLSESD